MQTLKWFSLFYVAILFFSSPAFSGPVEKTRGGWDPHKDVYAESKYPSAKQCATCHLQIYNEWASSNHAYASISPMFHKFEQKINDLSQGTVGNFCMRCHATVGSALAERRDKPLWERAKVSREGVTCITCHRIQEEYGKVNGERHIVPGEINEAPMSGNDGGQWLGEVLDKKSFYKVATDKKDRGTPIHTEIIKFKPITHSEFCLPCHQVAVHPGIKLEVVWDQYRDSPAFRKGVSCQACHMGTVPGIDSGYDMAPAAVVNGKPGPMRPHHNHAFYGPGYPIAHPGIFPHNPDNDRFTIEEWLEFDYRTPWGDPEWEDKVEDGDIEVEFPATWEDRYDREEAREIIEANLVLLEQKKKLRQQVMENGSRIDGPFFTKNPQVGKSFKFKYKITNLNEGHNLPSGSLGAQPEIWFNVALTDPSGKNIWESGYVDSYGDMADLHSHDVRQGKIEHDDQLENLQTKFLTTNVKGTDREMYLPINVDFDQLPFIRPAANPNTVMNHPPFIRMEARSIPPTGTRWAKYKVPGHLLKEPGTYKLSARMRSRAEPIYFMKYVRATVEMEEAMNKWMIDMHPYTVEIDVQDA